MSKAVNLNSESLKKDEKETMGKRIPSYAGRHHTQTNGGGTAVDDNPPETLKGIGASKNIASPKYQQMGPHENNVSAQTKPSRTPSNPEEHPDNFWNREHLPVTPQNTNTQNLQGCAGIQHRVKETTPWLRK